MAIPRDPDARRYYRAAGQRLDDARFILGAERTTAAVYLAGYCVECLLKALILAQTPTRRRATTLSKLKTHNYEDLRRLYTVGCGGTIPPDVLADLNFVAT